MADFRYKIEQACDTLQDRYCRLLLLTGTSAEKSTFADQCADYAGCEVIKLGAKLAQELLNIPLKQRSSKTNEFICGFMDKTSPIYFTEIEILFDKSLKIDPLALFKFVSRSRIVVVNWPGEYVPTAGTLLYADNDCLEYYESQLDKEIIYVDETGQTSMDYEYNGGRI